jgi:hypothetical protein
MTIDTLLRKWRNGKTSPEEYKQLVSALDSLATSAYLCGNYVDGERYSKIYSKVVLNRG